MPRLHTKTKPKINAGSFMMEDSRGSWNGFRSYLSLAGVQMIRVRLPVVDTNHSQKTTAVALF